MVVLVIDSVNDGCNGYPPVIQHALGSMDENGPCSSMIAGSLSLTMIKVLLAGCVRLDHQKWVDQPGGRCVVSISGHKLCQPEATTKPRMLETMQDT
jgi:hypothetical protein